MDVQEHIGQWLSEVPELAAAELPTTDAKAHAGLCTDLSKLISALQHLRSRALAEGARAQVDVRLGATSMGALVSRAHGGDRAEADRETRRGEDLATLPAVDSAASQGDLAPRQTSLIAKTLQGVPASLDAAQRRDCEEFLVDMARRHSIRSLKVACDRISERWLDTEREVDIAEGEILKARESKARQRAEFTMVDQGDGTYKGWFIVPEAQGDMLRAALEAIAAPRRDHLTGLDHQIDYKHRLGQAFTGLCDHLPDTALPQSGGMSARLVVKIDYTALISGEGVAELQTGTRLSASQARIMAANTGLLPAVMGGKSLVLDLGRSQRIFTEPQRIALALRDGGCSFPGCERPPAWCEAHHAKQAWARGGRTDLADGTLLCWHHHRHVEAHGWEFRLAPEGVVEWRPPASVDPGRRPRRNNRHRQPHREPRAS